MRHLRNTAVSLVLLGTLSACIGGGYAELPKFQDPVGAGATWPGFVPAAQILDPAGAKSQLTPDDIARLRARIKRLRLKARALQRGVVQDAPT